MRSSRSVIYTPDVLHFLKRITFGLPSNAPRLMSVRSAWLRAGSPLYHVQTLFFRAGYYIGLSYEVKGYFEKYGQLEKFYELRVFAEILYLDRVKLGL